MVGLFSKRSELNGSEEERPVEFLLFLGRQLQFVGGPSRFWRLQFKADDLGKERQRHRRNDGSLIQRQRARM